MLALSMEGLIPQLVYQKYKDLLHLKRYGHLTGKTVCCCIRYFGFNEIFIEIVLILLILQTFNFVGQCAFQHCCHLESNWCKASKLR